jgi:DNA repair protein RadC
MEVRRRAIKDWAESDRPREKMLEKRPQSLTDSELLAILIGTGGKHHSAIDLAKEVLEGCRYNLRELGKYSVRDLMRISGIGLAKAVAIVAAFELGRRRESGASLEKPVIRDSREAAGYLRPLLADLRHEVFGVLYLGQSGCIKKFEIVSEGGITSTTVDARRIFKLALEVEAVSILVCHNHPSGSLRPSKADEALTKKIQQGAAFMDIRLLDHLILGETGYFSFADEGLLC